MRPPDELIGEDEVYMKRWVLFKPSDVRRVVRIVGDGLRKRLQFMTEPRPRRPLPSVYLHEFLRSDDDRDFHCHVAWSISIVLWGGYWELTPDCNDPAYIAATAPELIACMKRRWRWRGPGSITIRRATSPHIIVLDRRGSYTNGRFSGYRALRYPPDGRRVFSLWIRGPWRREWGFYTEHGWLDWRTYDRMRKGILGAKP